ncbi:MAG: TRC40/GET3/ArsA family transport-energizing ATPase, partial [Dehalococcoidales bacterium]|nr:TRC40/GET3/ArsA family transport-energizing ATPase [Dehalococcoidales bacterium]
NNEDSINLGQRKCNIANFGCQGWELLARYDIMQGYGGRRVRVILYTGKGGVGKTTIAAASALRSAQLGYRTIILSTDSAHSLADSFDLALGNEPKLITSNLWGQETEMSQTLATHWGTIQRWVSTLLAWRGMDEIVADEMAILPGMEEVANLLYIVNYYRSGKYDAIIVDCAPTGQTLRFLSFPEILQWYMEKMFPIERKAASLARPLLKALTNIPMPEDEVFASIESLFYELNEMQALLSNHNVTSVRLVVNPEKMVIKEAQRTFTYFNLFGYLTDLIICNRIIPDKVDDQYFSFWKESQSKYYEVIKECFAPVPISTLPLLDREVVGIPMLGVIADALYREDNPTRLFFKGKVQDLQKEDEHYVLNLFLPFIEKGDISLMQSGDELIIRVGSFKRNIILPHTLIGFTATEARFDEGKLRIQFHQPQERR